jgi:hypothetical protein
MSTTMAERAPCRFYEAPSDGGFQCVNCGHFLHKHFGRNRRKTLKSKAEQPTLERDSGQGHSL